MCGIAGITGKNFSEAQLRDSIQLMVSRLIHRGPDYQGYWVDKTSSLAFGHARLSILDLSPTGNQPMASHSGRYMIVLNGEIYNFKSIKDELISLGHNFRGTSDTEVLLCAIEQWGFKAAIKRTTGMFALAVWDNTEKTLLLARDRVGEKPLYYGWLGHNHDQHFVFTSEVKALRALPWWQWQIDRHALGLYLRYNYIPAPFSIYKGIKKLTPGAMLTVKINTPHSEKEEPFWSILDKRATSVDKHLFENETSTIDHLEKLLQKTVSDQMISDVPLGAFLSGGIDSSLIVSLMQRVSTKKVKTFTIGFPEGSYDEAPYSRKIASHLKTDHTELMLYSKDLIEMVPRISSLYDEPFADTSHIPTYLVAKLARKHVTVSLSGDGGDELFGGYGHYLQSPRIKPYIDYIPHVVRASLSKTIKTIPTTWWTALNKSLSLYKDEYGQGHMFGDKVHKLADLITVDSVEDFYFRRTSCWRHPGSVLLNAPNGNDFPFRYPNLPSHVNIVEKLMLYDFLCYLPDDIMVKVDRAAMAVSLESRAPFLNHNIVEFAASLPLSYKIRDRQGKWILRELLKRFIPAEFFERPKQGFGIPNHDWLRGPLKEWVEEQIDETRLLGEGYFDQKLIRSLWNEHLSGKRNWFGKIWNICMFQSWLTP